MMPIAALAGAYREAIASAGLRAREELTPGGFARFELEVDQGDPGYVTFKRWLDGPGIRALERVEVRWTDEERMRARWVVLRVRRAEVRMARERIEDWDLSGACEVCGCGAARRVGATVAASRAPLTGLARVTEHQELMVKRELVEGGGLGCVKAHALKVRDTKGRDTGWVVVSTGGLPIVRLDSPASGLTRDEVLDFGCGRCERDGWFDGTNGFAPVFGAGAVVRDGGAMATWQVLACGNPALGLKSLFVPMVVLWDEGGRVAAALKGDAAVEVVPVADG